ncbi:MAG TPA: trehalase-like domain-containing protein, partial [Burkholderiaceae bacterium]|nr:trehalase-like domain-containing protein [Burkholderiaceae bacterium]
MQASPAPQAAPASLELALIGNCQISALIDARAQIVWCCMPRFDSTPVFDALMHSDSGIGTEGVLSVEIEHLARSEQRYEPGTAIVRTELWDEQGQGIEVVDFAPRFITRDRPFRPAQLVRRVRPLAGHPRVRFRVTPRGDWGRTAPTLTRGSHHLRYILPELVLRLTSNVPQTYLVDQTWFSLHKPVSLLLGPDETLDAGIEETARSFEEQTSLYWRHWTHRLALPLEWQDAVIRAAITLKLCQFEETGAIVAAMTTSIPEAPHSGRNWDYRYCWIRDAFFVVRALNGLSEVGTMESYLNWLYNVIRGARDGHVQP